MIATAADASFALVEVILRAPKRKSQKSEVRAPGAPKLLTSGF
jgi:hypothetical protein